MKNLFAAAFTLSLLTGCTFFERTQKCDLPMPTREAHARNWPAILDNGVRVMVPPHITAGTRIVVDVYEQEYVRRAD